MDEGVREIKILLEYDQQMGAMGASSEMNMFAEKHSSAVIVVREGGPACTSGRLTERGG